MSSTYDIARAVNDGAARGWTPRERREAFWEIVRELNRPGSDEGAASDLREACLRLSALVCPWA